MPKQSHEMHVIFKPPQTRTVDVRFVRAKTPAPATAAKPVSAAARALAAAVQRSKQPLQLVARMVTLLLELHEERKLWLEMMHEMWRIELVGICLSFFDMLVCCCRYAMLQSPIRPSISMLWSRWRVQ